MFYDPEDNDAGGDAGGYAGDDSSSSVDSTQDYGYEDLDYGLREGDTSGWERRGRD